MRTLNEPTACRANKENNHTVKLFFEARFKSQSLLDVASPTQLYGLADRRPLDLNPIRACMAGMPETSEHTSLKKRIEATQAGSIPKQLLQFQGSASKEKLRYIVCE